MALVQKAAQIEQALVRDVGQTCQDISVAALVEESIFLKIQYMFPAGPILHELSLRQDFARIFGTSESGHSPSLSRQLSGCTEEEAISLLRGFALLTTITASSTAVYRPASVQSGHKELAIAFLRASRDTLKLFGDYDIEFPNSQSIQVRLIQSSAFQHTTGRPGMTNHLLGEAQLLAKELCLHDEAVIEKYPPLEGQLLRNCFWLMWTADRSAHVLSSRPICLDHAVLESHLTLQATWRTAVPLLDSSRPCHRPPYEEQALDVFHFSRRMRSAAARVVRGLKAFRPPESETGESHLPRQPRDDIETLASIYRQFEGFRDEMPPCIKSPEQAIVDHPADDEETTQAKQYQRDSFLTQKAHLMLSFHCMRMVILHQCVESGLTIILELSGWKSAVSTAELDIGGDFVQTLEEVPFDSIRMNGEPCV